MASIIYIIIYLIMYPSCIPVITYVCVVFLAAPILFLFCNLVMHLEERVQEIEIPGDQPQMDGIPKPLVAGMNGVDGVKVRNNDLRLTSIEDQTKLNTLPGLKLNILLGKIC